MAYHKEPEDPRDPFGNKEKSEMFPINGKMERFKRICICRTKGAAEENKAQYMRNGYFVRTEREAPKHYHVYVRRK
jgi:hypothetical protein